MVKRTITAVVALCVFVPILIFSGTWAFPIAMGICSIVGVWEMIRCIGQKKNFFLIIPLCAASMFMPIFMRYVTLNMNKDIGIFLKAAVVLAIAVSLYVFTVAVFGNKTLNIADAGLLLAVFLYVSSAFTATVYIRDYVHNGEYLFYLPFLIGWVTDTFAYFTGRLFGKHKLIPSVSPKKTVEGAIGGTLFGAIAMVLYAFLINRFFDPADIIKPNYLALAIVGIIIPIVGQIGDLIMSVIKRHYNIKDYGNFFPGHGGMLDRFDSAIANLLVLAAACACYNSLL